MTSRRTATWHRLFSKLPTKAQDAAEEQYRNWKQDPNHTSVKFGPITHAVFQGYQCYEARLTLGVRAICFKDTDQDIYFWFWCGSHNDFDKLVRQLR